MDYKIVQKPALTAVGYVVRAPTAGGEHMAQIPQFWDECIANGSLDRLHALGVRAAVFSNTLLGVIVDMDTTRGELTYMIGVDAPSGSAAEGMTEVPVPAGAWAVFEARGEMPDAVQSLWGRIMTEFVPPHPYKRAGGPELEVYPNDGPMDENYTCEVWIPMAA